MADEHSVNKNAPVPIENSVSTKSSLPSERRRYTRVSFTAQTEIRQGSRRWNCELVDVSLKGALVREPSGYTFSESLPCHIIITLTSHVDIEMQVALAWHQSRLMGFTCEKIDVDSIGHLRRLIELNMGDPDATQAEWLKFISPRE